MTGMKDIIRETPMKPQIEGDAGAWGSWWYICPVCNDPIDYRQSECGRCHQKIDWTKAGEKE